MIDRERAAGYALQLRELLTAQDPARVLGNPAAQAVLMSLTKDLAELVDGPDGEVLRAQLDGHHVWSDKAGEIFIIG